MPLLWGFVAAAGAPTHEAAQTADRNLSERVATAVHTYPPYGVFDSVDVAVQDQAVTLTGRVTDPRKRDDIEVRVRKIDGVRTLTNEIGVLPVSRSDDDLRSRVARAIYSHPTFWVHGQRPVPPIHIIVERGRIMLTGVAASDAERALALSLAQVPGSFGVTDRLRLP